MFDESDARQLLTDNQDIQNSISSIKVNDYITSFMSNVSSYTQTNSGINDGNISDYIIDPNVTLMPDLDSVVDNLDTVIKLMNYFDGDVDPEALLSLASLVDLNSEDKFRYDIMFDDDSGESYILFTQKGHEGEKSLLNQFRYFLTDGKGGKSGTSIAGASCSMCSSVNAVANLVGLDKFLKTMDIDEKLLSSNSLNASLLTAFNSKLYGDYVATHPDKKAIDLTKVGGRATLGENKEVLFELLANRFSDQINYNAYRSNAPDFNSNIFQDVANGNAKMVARLGMGAGRYKTAAGHFIEINDYRVDPDGSQWLYVLDSAPSYESTRENASNEQKRRTGWVPYDDVMNRLKESETENNLFVFSLKEDNNGVAV